MIFFTGELGQRKILIIDLLFISQVDNDDLFYADYSHEVVIIWQEYLFWFQIRIFKVDDWVTLIFSQSMFETYGLL